MAASLVWIRSEMRLLGRMTEAAASPSRGNQSAGGYTTCHASWSPEEASTASCPASAHSTGWQIYIHKAHTSMSDHLSGYRALADPTIDLTDLYAFPSPSRPRHLVLVMNVFPEAHPSAHFSDQANYRFRLRPVSIAPRHFDVGPKEFAFTCTFASDDATCVLPNGAAVSFRRNEVTGSDA